MPIPLYLAGAWFAIYFVKLALAGVVADYRSKSQRLLSVPLVIREVHFRVANLQAVFEERYRDQVFSSTEGFSPLCCLKFSLDIMNLELRT